VARVDENVNGKIRFFLEETKDQPVQSQVGPPIYIPRVVSGNVGTEIRELQSGALFLGSVFSLEMPGKKAAGNDLQILQLLEELVVKKCA
jgi:hypothetical protein